MGTPEDAGALRHLLGTPEDAHPGSPWPIHPPSPWPAHPPSPWPAPDHRVCAHDELGLGVPLVVGDVVVGLEPNPLLAFGQKPVAARLPFAKLHHCDGRRSQRITSVKTKGPFPPTVAFNNTSFQMTVLHTVISPVVTALK